MADFYRVSLDEKLLHLRNTHLDKNKPLAEKLMVLCIVCLLAAIPILMFFGIGGYLYPLLVIGGLSGLASFILFRSALPLEAGQTATVLFTSPSSIVQVPSQDRRPMYNLNVDGRNFAVSQAIYQAMPTTGKIAVFFTEDKNLIFHITRADWVNPKDIEPLFTKTKK